MEAFFRKGDMSLGASEEYIWFFVWQNVLYNKKRALTGMLHNKHVLILLILIISQVENITLIQL